MLVYLMTSDHGSDRPLKKPHFFFFLTSINVSRKFSSHSVKLIITQLTSLFPVFLRYVGWAKPKIFLCILMNVVS